MTELKTLKDINKELNYSVDASENVYAYQERLTQEAIKWIKEIGYNEDNPPILLDKPEQTINWIKYFFNITEEDLK